MHQPSTIIVLEGCEAHNADNTPAGSQEFNPGMKFRLRRKRAECVPASLAHTDRKSMKMAHFECIIA